MSGTYRRTGLVRAGIAGLAMALGLMLLPAAAPTMAQMKNATETRNEATVQRSFDAWADGSGSPYDLLADDAVWTIVGRTAVSRTYTSREDFLGNVIRPFRQRMASRFVPTIKEIHSDGGTVIVYFEAEGTARDGKPYRNTYSWFLGLRGDKIVKATAFFDSIAFNEFWQRVAPAP